MYAPTATHKATLQHEREAQTKTKHAHIHVHVQCSYRFLVTEHFLHIPKLKKIFVFKNFVIGKFYEYLYSILLTMCDKKISRV